jgi:dihydrofolate synthase/folylpolyglutamate synthase
MERLSTYQETLDYLYSFIDYSMTRDNRYSPEKFDLGRMFTFAEHLGNPQNEYNVLHIAGTKGKGSVAAMCASVLERAGYRVGLYTSPHLQDYLERIQVNGVSITESELTEKVNQVKPYLDDGTELTTFEITTALGFSYFQDMDVDVAVIEVGLGGRLDATNIVIPTVSVITSLSFDHSEFLGDTLAKIATEKAGIIKPGIPVVISPQKEEARLVLERIASERGSPLTQVGKDILYAAQSRNLNQQSFLIWSSGEQTQVDEYIESGGDHEWEPVRLSIPLLGYHQVENAATAYTALSIAQTSGVEISDSAIKQGFLNVNWPARFEILQRNPTLVVDSAHNRDSALKLRLALDDYFPGQKVTLVFGASRDKDVSGMFAKLMPRIDRVILTRSYHPRSMEPEELIEYVHRFGKPAEVVEKVEDALDYAVETTAADNLVLATGSLFIAAGARDTWRKRSNTHKNGDL